MDEAGERVVSGLVLDSVRWRNSACAFASAETTSSTSSKRRLFQLAEGRAAEPEPSARVGIE
jgi:hypothetical protein